MAVARLVATRQEILEVRERGIPRHSVQSEPATWWGALNAVTAWTDDQQDVRGERFVHLPFGSGDRIKTRATRLVVAAAAIPGIAPHSVA